jgi:hypothetical protein
MNVMYRQGDVLLIRQEHLPDGAKELQREPSRIVLAYGEATGHAHVVSAELSRAFALADGTRFIQTKEGASLTHEEHAPIDMAPGVYRVVLQREYTNIAEVRYVRD